MLREFRIDNSRDLKVYISEIMGIRIRILIGVVREDRRKKRMMTECECEGGDNRRSGETVYLRIGMKIDKDNGLTVIYEEEK